MKVLPENILRCMTPADRKAIGQQTAAEASETFDARQEKQLHRLIEAELTRRGVVVIHSAMHRRTTTAKGVPDFLFAIKGVPYAIEAKTATGRIREEQAWMLARMKENGWHCAIVRSFEEFKREVFEG